MAKHVSTTSEQDNINIAELAATPFAPWNDTDEPRVSVAEWRDLASRHVATVRIAYELMFKSKDELAASIEKGGQETLDILMDSFDQTKEWAEQAITLLGSAEARIICAIATLAQRDAAE